MPNGVVEVTLDDSADPEVVEETSTNEKSSTKGDSTDDVKEVAADIRVVGVLPGNSPLAAPVGYGLRLATHIKPFYD